MRELTARQREILDLRNSQEPPLTSVQIAQRLGVADRYVRKVLRTCEAKLEALAQGPPPSSEPILPAEAERPRPRGGGKPTSAHAVESKDPEKAAAAIDAIASPLAKSLRKIAEECGLPRDTARVLAKRVASRYAPIKLAVEATTAEALALLAGDRARRLIESVSEEDIRAASLRDRMVSFGISVDKFQLLSSRPTGIVTIKQSQNLAEALVAVRLEMERRGIVESRDSETGELKIEKREERLAAEASVQFAGPSDRREARSVGLPAASGDRRGHFDID